MARLLFRLRGVPEDEADEVRALLDQAGIAYYETPPDMWGVSMQAIWLQDEAREEEAKGLIDDYQQARARRARDAYDKARSEGTAEGLLDRVRRHPVQFLLYIALILFVLYLSTHPFLHFGR
jgi:hypothetical protein